MSICKYRLPLLAPLVTVMAVSLVGPVGIVVHVALVLVSGEYAMAERVSTELDDSVWMMQMAHALSSRRDRFPHDCEDSDNGATAYFGHMEYSCSDKTSSSPDVCTNPFFADADFSPDIMCCSCRGFGFSLSTPLPQETTPALTSLPTPMPTPSPSAPSAIPTSAPTQGHAAVPTAAPGAEATGDPHVTNVDGERFDIMKKGAHEFLRFPRRASQSPGSVGPTPLLSVWGAVEGSYEDGCHETYLKQVDVTGEWLVRSVGPLRFRADGQSLDGDREVILSINGSLVSKGAFGSYTNAWPFLEVIDPKSSDVNHESKAIQKVPMYTVKLIHGGVTLKVDWVHRAVPGGQPLNHLNFQALGLRKLVDGYGMDIGGILGRDDHSDAASLPGECKPAGADHLRVSDRASGADADPQVITAAW